VAAWSNVQVLPPQRLVFAARFSHSLLRTPCLDLEMKTFVRIERGRSSKPVSPDQREGARLPSPSSDAPLDVLLIGPISPPFGGVASHIERLRRLLPPQDLRVGVLSHYGAPATPPDIAGYLHRNPLLYWAAIRRHKSRIVHYHHSHWLLLVAVGLAAHGDSRRYVVTVHGHELETVLHSRIRPVAALARWALRQFDDVIAVSEEIASDIRAHGGAERVHIIPAFLAPGPAEPVKLDAKSEEFFAGGSPVLVASCSQLCARPGTSDRYGFDLAVEAFCEIGGRNPGIRLALFLGRPPSTRGEHEYVQLLERRVLASGLGRRLLILVEAPLPPAFSYDVVYLRPTLTDGDAVSVREALAMNVPVLASDVVRRPAGTRTFRGGDAGALCSELTELLRRRADPRDDAAGRAGDDGESKAMLQCLLAVYGASNRGSS
jgi:glycogen(starch) synthase